MNCFPGHVRNISKRWFSVIIIITLFGAFDGVSQNLFIQHSDSSIHNELRRSLKEIRNNITQEQDLAALSLEVWSPHLNTSDGKRLHIPRYQPLHYGAFCRIETKIEASSKVPLRFRLGSLDYVNYLEQKYVLERPKESKKFK